MKITFDQRDALHQYYLMNNLKTSKGRQLLRGISNIILRKHLCNFEGGEFCFFKSFSRNDYLQLFDNIYSNCAYSKGWISWKTEKGFNAKGLSTIFSNFHVLGELKNIKKPHRFNEPDNGECFRLGLLDRWIVYCGLIFSNLIMEGISRTNLKDVKAVVVLSDVWQPEHALVRFANQSGLYSITCQHALFHPGLDNTSFDFLNFWRLPSKAQLAWGEGSKELMLSNNKGIFCRVCGNPSIAKKEYHEDNSVIGIAMDFPKYKKYNQQMIGIAEDYARANGKKIRLRVHPVDSKENYKIDSNVSEFNGDLDSCFCILAHATTMIFIYLASGKKLFRYKSDKAFFDLGEDLVFNSVESLTRHINQIATIDFKKGYQYELSYIGKDSENRYKEAFDEIYSML